MIRPKHLVFALIFAMMGYVLVHNERFLVEPENPYWAHSATYGRWIVAHVIAGAAAMFLAPLQFSERLRRRYTSLHRASGYVYVAGMSVLAPLGACTSSTSARNCTGPPGPSPCSRASTL